MSYSTQGNFTSNQIAATYFSATKCINAIDALKKYSAIITKKISSHPLKQGIMHMVETPKKLHQAMLKERRKWKTKCLQRQENRRSSKCREGGGGGGGRELKQNQGNTAHLGLVKCYMTVREC